MPTPCYISIEGKTQGNITAGAFTSDSVGNIYVQGHEDEMLVQEFNHVVTVPTDPQSGQPSGQRVHKPFKFTVALNKAVPLLYNALASGEMLPTVTLKWFRTSVEGKQELFLHHHPDRRHHRRHQQPDAALPGPVQAGLHPADRSVAGLPQGGLGAHRCRYFRLRRLARADRSVITPSPGLRSGCCRFQPALSDGGGHRSGRTQTGNKEEARWPTVPDCSLP